MTLIIRGVYRGHLSTPSMIAAKADIPFVHTARAVIASSILLGACVGDKGPTAPVPVLTKLTLSLPPWITVGETVVAQVSGFDQNGARTIVGPVTWSTTSAPVATVNIYGTVTGAAPGETQVIATARGIQARQSITVVPVPVVAVTVSPTAATLTVGATLQLTATTFDPDDDVLTGRVITWSSSDSTRVKVSASGLATAVAPGSATVTATSEGKSGAAVITVSP